MRKIIFIGRSEAGKTTLTQAMKGKKIVYHKTQYINHYDVIIDTPGEYAETKELAGSLAVYSAEADVVGLLISATEPFSLYPPNVTAQANREVVGIVTKCDHWAGNPEQAAEWLRLAGCKKIFMTSSFTQNTPACSPGGRRSRQSAWSHSEPQGIPRPPFHIPSATARRSPWRWACLPS